MRLKLCKTFSSLAPKTTTVSKVQVPDCTGVVDANNCYYICISIFHPQKHLRWRQVGTTSTPSAHWIESFSMHCLFFPPCTLHGSRQGIRRGSGSADDLSPGIPRQGQSNQAPQHSTCDVISAILH